MTVIKCNLGGKGNPFLAINKTASYCQNVISLLSPVAVLTVYKKQKARGTTLHAFCYICSMLISFYTRK